MGNEANKSEKTKLKEPIEDKRILFPGYSNKLSKLIINNQNNKINTDKTIDKEDIIISKVIEATLNKDESNNYIYLDEYVAFLSSNLSPKKFRIKNLEYIIEYMYRDMKNPLDYLFECFHRSIEMIEIKPIYEFDD